MKDSKEYRAVLENLRYLLLAMEMPGSPDAEAAKEEVEKNLNKKIHPVDGHIVQIRDSDNPEYRYKIGYLSKDEEGRTVIKEKYTDFYINATGYISKIGDILGYDKNPFNDPESSEAVIADFPEENKRLPVGVKLKGKKIYGMGPAALGNVLFDAEAETTGVRQSRKTHPVNIATFGPRTEKLAQLAAQHPEKKLPVKQYETPPFEITKKSGGAGGPIVLTRKNPGEKLPNGGEFLDEIWIKTELAKLFEHAHAEGLEKVAINVTRSKDNKDAIAVEVNPNVEGVTEKINADLVDCLTSFMRGSRWNLVLEIPFFRGGKVDAPSINIKKELVARSGR